MQESRGLKMNDHPFLSRSTIGNKQMNKTYIKAFCLIKKQPRIFKINLILAAFYVKENKGYA